MTHDMLVGNTLAKAMKAKITDPRPFPLGWGERTQDEPEPYRLEGEINVGDEFFWNHKEHIRVVQIDAHENDTDRRIWHVTIAQELEVPNSRLFNDESRIRECCERVIKR
jgi:hypothetical protein